MRCFGVSAAVAGRRAAVRFFDVAFEVVLEVLLLVAAEVRFGAVWVKTAAGRQDAR